MSTRTLAALVLGAAFAAAPSAWPRAAAVAADGPRYEHRVVVATTARELGWQVHESLERNVNRLAAVGFEVAAFVGGDGLVLDKLLLRGAPGAPITTPAIVIMTRPIGVPVQAREYRLWHIGNNSTVGFDEYLARLRADGFRLATFAVEGSRFHGAFERTAGSAAPVEYHIYSNKFRNSWVKQLQDDTEALARLTRVVPVQLDMALVELGTAADPPGEVDWAPDAKAHDFGSRLESALNQRASAGFLVNLLRLRNDDVDVLLVKPAGRKGPVPTYDLDEGPWGSRCGRGVIAGADVYKDGDMYCVADTTQASVTNQGLDLTIRAYDSAKGMLLFGPPETCEMQARLEERRPAARWVGVAATLEHELNAKVAPGFRVTRALAATGTWDQMRVYAVVSTVPPTAGAGPVVTAAPAPPLRAEHDELLGDQVRQHEDEVNDALRQNPYLKGASIWVEIHDARGNRYVRIAGCTSSRQDREIAENAVRSALARTPYAGYRIRNDVTRDAFR